MLQISFLSDTDFCLMDELCFKVCENLCCDLRYFTNKIAVPRQVYCIQWYTGKWGDSTSNKQSICCEEQSELQWCFDLLCQNVWAPFGRVHEIDKCSKSFSSPHQLLLSDWYIGNTPVVRTGRWSIGCNARLFQWILLLICNICCIDSV